MKIVNESTSNVSFDGVTYPKNFYAQPYHNGQVGVHSKSTDKIFVLESYSTITVDGTGYDNNIDTVNALNLILSI